MTAIHHLRPCLRSPVLVLPLRLSLLQRLNHRPCPHPPPPPPLLPQARPQRRPDLQNKCCKKVTSLRSPGFFQSIKSYSIQSAAASPQGPLPILGLPLTATRSSQVVEPRADHYWESQKLQNLATLPIANCGFSNISPQNCGRKVTSLRSPVFFQSIKFYRKSFRSKVKSMQSAAASRPSPVGPPPTCGLPSTATRSSQDVEPRFLEIRRSFYINILIGKIIGKSLPVGTRRRTMTKWFRLLKTRRGCRLLLKSRFLQELHSSMQEEDLERTKKFGSAKVCLGSSFAEHNRMKRDLFHFKYLLLSKRRKDQNKNQIIDIARTRSPFVYTSSLYSNSTYYSGSPFTRKTRIKRIQLPTHYLEMNYRTLKAVMFYGPNIGDIPQFFLRARRPLPS